MKSSTRYLLFAAFGATGAVGVAAAPAPAPAPAAQANVAQQRGAGVLMARCLSCHSAEKKAGGIDLSTRAGAEAAGVTGPDDPAKNRLIRAVTTGKMPPTGKLPAEEIAAVRAWLRAGMAYPSGGIHAQSIPDQPLWSLAPVRRPAVPKTPYDALAKNAVDRFLFAKLAERGLRPSPPARKLQLLRRVTIDLTGLPPTPAEIVAFLADKSPAAYEKVVDRLLASPAYGERWAQHWLDVVRYGESHGYEQNHIRPNAWPYRDYVIRALNEDKPYHRFVQEQLAGDAMAKGDPWTDAATGFLVAGIHDTVGNQAEEGARLQRVTDLDDMVATTGEAFLALTIGCAKCHDHKFDPIPQKDYYRLAAVFAGVRHGERALGDPTPAGDGRHREEFAPVTARFVRFTISATNDGAQPCLDELEVYGPASTENFALASSGARAMASSLLPGFTIHQISHLNDGQLGNAHSWISNEPGKGWAQIELPAATSISRVVWSRDGQNPSQFSDRVPTGYVIELSEDGKSWRKVLAKLPQMVDPKAGSVQTGVMAYAGQFGDPHPVYVLKRGDVMQRGEEVRPAGLSRVPELSPEFGAGNTPLSDRERRLDLARWITDPRNPLTARVLVNRLWSHHFGRGLVGTPSDFGHNGEKPTHPELLDWLASDFMAHDWTQKRLHRILVTSYVYRQSTATNPRAQAVDAGNQLLWRMPLRRMEAEAIRDAILAASGKLDRRMGGPSYQLYKYRTVNVAIYEPLDEYGPDTWRRGVYRQPARAIRDGLLGAFDCPESAQRAPRRESTTTALQALSLLNGPFTVQQAGFLAERATAETGKGSPLDAQIRRAFVLTFGRSPSPTEARAARELAVKDGLPALCRALLNANEFLYY